MTRTRPRTGLATGLFAVCVAALVLVLLVVWLPGHAGALSYGACYEQREETWIEYSRTIVVEDEVTATEVLFQKQIKVDGAWQDYPGVTRWEPEGVGEEGWIAGVRYRYRPTGESRTVVVTPEVTETITEWSSSPLGDDWAHTGAARVEVIDVEVPCPPPLCACLPVEDMPCDLPPECATPPTTTPETPPTTVDHGPEPEADHTAPPTLEVAPVPVAAVEQPRTLPRTGLTEEILALGIVLLAVGVMLAGVEFYDRRHRART